MTVLVQFGHGVHQIQAGFTSAHKDSGLVIGLANAEAPVSLPESFA